MRTILFAFVLFIFTSMGAKELYSIEVENTLNIDRFKSLVEIPLNEICVESGRIYVVDSNGVEKLSQITSDSTLLFEAGVAAREKNIYYILDKEKTEKSTKVYGRYFSERYGDFAWENDCVGFRLYGNPLEKIQVPTNGLDIWLKRTDRMVLEDWYANDISKKASYHIDYGEGCDPYAVGPTLGAGAIAPYVNGTIVRNTNHISYKVIDKGPLRIKFEINYPNLEIDGKVIPDSKIIILDAGSYYTKIEQNYGLNKLDVAVGIVKRAGKNSLSISSDKNYMIYEDLEMPEDGQVYIGVIFPHHKMVVKQNRYTLGNSEFNHNIALATASKKSFIYYTGFGWSKSKHPKLSDFITYTENFILALDSPVKVKITKLK